MQNFRSFTLCHKAPDLTRGRSLDAIKTALLWELCSEDTNRTSHEVLSLARQKSGDFALSVRHLNRLRKAWSLNRPKGRPNRKKSHEAVSRFNTFTSCVGLHVFDHWLEQKGVFGSLYPLFQEAIISYTREHPGASFPLLFHRKSTFLLRFKALLYASLFGVEKLREYDRTEHALETVVGRNYQSSTLNQFLGQLEKIDAASFLMPMLLSQAQGTLGYVDGHMVPYWTGESMHKGKITMLGRIMPGSQAVVCHDENGQALFFDYYPPDLRLTRVGVEYCEQIVEDIDIQHFVIDREVNSIEFAREFEARDWGLLSMLNSNEYKGLESFETKSLVINEDGETLLYKGVWKNKKKREEDPRRFVLSCENGRVLVFWGTSAFEKAFELRDWPKIYRKRAEVQENSFKRMIAHGALNTNFGTKKIEGPDRHQQRAEQEAMQKLDKAMKRQEKKLDLEKQQRQKIKESKERGHRKLLEKRERKLREIQEETKKSKQKEEKRLLELERTKEPGTRKDRDFRKQKVMTFRTLFLENFLRLFLSVLSMRTGEKLSMETLLELFFRRSGGYVESATERVYWLNAKGVSSDYRRLLKKLSQALDELGLEYAGKNIRIHVRAGP